MAKNDDDDDDRNGRQALAATTHSNQRQKWKTIAVAVVVGLLVVIGIVVLVVTLLGSDNPTDSTTTTTTTTTETNKDADEEGFFTQRGSYRLLATYPHDTKAYCQGLEVKNETHVYESIGMYGESALRVVEITTGRVTWETAMDAAYFGEGVTLVVDDQNEDTPYLLQLTWREKKAFVYHPESLAVLGEFPYQTTNGQGWGVAYDTHQPGIVYVTDGTEFVHTWKMITGPNGEYTYKEIAKVPVTFSFVEMEQSRTLRNVNELEYDPTTRTLLANIYFENVIVRIDIATGRVTKVYGFPSLYTNRIPEADVFNGIARIPHAPHGQYYVTGKYWPHLYHVELVE